MPRTIGSRVKRIEVQTLPDGSFVCQVTRYNNKRRVYRNVTVSSWRRLWSLKPVPWSYPHLGTYVWVF